MPPQDNPVFAWVEALDDLSYYELFGLEAGVTPDEIQAAFHVFCETFHPDGHVARDDGERRALTTIFKRGTEAYSVLVDPALRAQYDAQLASTTSPRPPRVSFSPLSRPPSRMPGAAVPLEEAVRSPSARPFARRAEELVAQGDLRQAKLQLVMANHMDPGNAALEQALRDLESKLGSPK
jgi:curved DNA-binding protein CbpA